MVNLQDLVLPGSDLALTEPIFINDRGEIVGNAVLPNGDQHAFLLIPCNENHPNIEGCDYHLGDANTTVQIRGESSPVTSENNGRPIGWRERLNGRLMHRPGFDSVRSPRN